MPGMGRPTQCANLLEESVLNVVNKPLLLQAILFQTLLQIREFELGSGREVLDVVFEVPS